MSPGFLVSPNKTFQQSTRSIDALREHPSNVRESIDKNDPEIIALAEDIKQRGILEPLIITEQNFILAGHRRRVAARLAGLTIVPVVVRDLHPGENAIDIMLSENLQRQSLSPLEEARAYKALMEAENIPTLKDLARRISIPAPTLSARMSVLKCCETVQRLYHTGLLPVVLASHFAAIEDEERQIYFANLAARKELNHTKLKALLNEEIDKQNRKTENSKPRVTPDIERPDREARKQENAQRKVWGNQHGTSEVITRESAVALVSKSATKQISAHTLGVVFNQTCNTCPAFGNTEVCKSCPLPRFTSSLIGRAS